MEIKEGFTLKNCHMHSRSKALYEYTESVNTDAMERLNRNAKEKWRMLIRYGIKRGEHERSFTFEGEEVDVYMIHIV